MSIARNQPCPCGSGKRYKQCCGTLAAGQSAAPAAAIPTITPSLHALLLASQTAADQGDWRQAIATMQQAADLQPQDATLHFNLGALQQSAGRLHPARLSYLQALKLDPKYGDALNNLGVVYEELGQIDDARRCFEQVLSSQPRDTSALTNLGRILYRLGQPQQAVQRYEQALAIDPDLVPAIHNRAEILQQRGQLPEAIAGFRRALQLSPATALIWGNLGNALADQGRTAEAEAAYHRSLQLEPNAGIQVRSALLLPMLVSNEAEIMSARRRYADNIAALLRQRVRLADPVTDAGVVNFLLPYHGLDDLSLQRDLAAFYRAACPQLQFTAPHCRQPYTPGPRIRIGLVSELLKMHSVGRTVQGLVTFLPRPRFEVWVFSAKHADDEVVQALREHADHYRALPTDLDAARDAVAAAKLDILLYPDIGMTALTYFMAFARLAPVQCLTWGHLCTSGIPTLDYFLSHAGWEPAAAQSQYSERLLLTENCPPYPAFRRPAPPPRLNRADYALPTDAHLYVCPQSLFKIHPDCDAVFAEILHADPQAHLVLFAGLDAYWQETLLQRLAPVMGAALPRVRVLPRQRQDTFRGILALCDVMLDTLHVGGGVTTMDGFSVHLPIVTLPGDTMRSRFTTACYQYLGLTECIATSAADYVAISVKLGTQPEFRRQVQQRLADQVPRLFDNQDTVLEFARLFEQALAAAPERA